MIRCLTYIVMASPLVAGDAISFKEDHVEGWASAVAYCERQRAGWTTVFDAYGVDGDMAEAVVFPELVRYGACQDYIETAVVYGSYVAIGSSGFNFSIGRFQMKPSFAEALEKRWMQTDFAVTYETFFDTDDTSYARKTRLSRLSDGFWQSVYLAIFIKLFQYDYHIEGLTEEQQVVLAATAYNAGCEWGGSGETDVLEEKSTEMLFHTDFLPSEATSYYSYSDIAVEYWKERKRR